MPDLTRSYGFVLLFAALGSSGCPGKLDNPERFQPDATLDCTSIDVESDIFIPRCATAGCHDATVPSAGLDLLSAGSAARLIDVVSGCNDRVLFDPLDAAGGYLLEKMREDMPGCGSRMPLGTGKLEDWEVDCVQEWLEAQP